ncbi:hypothetical protein P3X46_001354 [Hevea brasiliensis]|uniref:Thionin-like protein 2 n=1 Tax=Hevea brasiliensis TaxID=3981 RepID=A0ABQ9NCW7_HEVBR|nr:thionin-like protein 2 [Hevea brasiliensis]KAJ9190124.1 hypothetical protein P3X46_001354 [Hevea brasiliensis]
MEERRARFLMVVFVVLGMAVGQCTAASFSDCYKGCFLLCVITPGNSLCSCGSKCLKDCIFPSSITSLSGKEQTHYFCKFGCASSLCTNLSTKQDPGEKKVASCVDSCSSRCSKNFSP